ncbi:Carbohydrate binding module family 25, partial [Cynara cardunculus var. scolymus]
MEVALHVQSCRNTVLNEINPLKIKPFVGVFPTRRPNMFSQFIHKDSMVVGVSHQIIASSDFSSRRRRKYVNARSKHAAPKGYLPKPNNQRRMGEDLKGSKVKEYVSSNQNGIDTKFIVDQVHKAEMEKDIGALIDDVSMEEHLWKEQVEAKIHKQEMEEKLRKQDMDEFLRKKATKAKIRKQQVDRLVIENVLRNEKVFSYPEVLRPDRGIEIFLNKNASTLINETDVLIIGAFNDWRYKSFTEKLSKTHLTGEWWSCKIHVPKEAYKIDFVFFNGKDVYENNDMKDFWVPVEGGMGAVEFEELLLEEKRQDLEKLAKEEAEMEKQKEEEREIEAEKAASETDRAEARAQVNKRREKLEQVLNKTAKSFDNLWYIEPNEFKGKDTVRLYYNKGLGPLAKVKDLWIHGGYNNWQDGLSYVTKLVKAEENNGDWWYVDVFVPTRALLLDWVFADAPPQHAIVYDNDLQNDFHAIVPASMPQDLYWEEEERIIYKKLHDERKLREEETRAKAQKTQRMKAETKRRSMKTFLLSQKNIVYTEPLDVQAREPVTVFYNPANSVLNGKPEIWFRCSFNRWTHRIGLLPPQKMLPADDGLHVKISGKFVSFIGISCNNQKQFLDHLFLCCDVVKVPLDAYMMDFVFSDRESDDGAFDNKNGMDYHIPVFGGVAKEPPMHIVHIAVEMAPIAKVGGLADVVTSLSRAVQDLNHQVKKLGFHRSYFWGGTEIKVWLGEVEGLSVYFLEPQNGLFWAGCIYGCRNDEERFRFFSHAALEFLLQRGSLPDVIHCHDWSSAPVAWLLKDHYMHHSLGKASVVFTIHNLEFGAHLIGKAMAYADKATTVSPTYSHEVAGNPVIAPHLHKFHGILNGIDPDIWDPYNDKFLPVSYSADNVVEGKRAAKEALQHKLGLKKADLPLVGIITRLTHQKGIHLIKHAIWRTLDRGGQVVLLGSAPDPSIQNDFVNLASQLHSLHNERARLCLTFDEPLSHLIYAGADFILVPSIFEPCGLTQLTAMRYGSVPIVRKTGGLYDTVFDVDDDKDRAQSQGLKPNGFSFEVADIAGVDYAINRQSDIWLVRWSRLV